MVARGIRVNLIFPLARHFLNALAAKKVKLFEDSLKDPKLAQENLLKKWADNRTYLEAHQSYEYTSGSSGAKKKIGYTTSLKDSFSDMFLLWSYDILNHAPIKLKSGVIYMSLSPRITDHGGVDNDAEYVAWYLRPVMKKFLAVDPSMQRVKSGADFYDKVARELLKRNDLEIISVWSPTYFLNLLNYIQDHRKELGLKGTFKDQWPDLQMISSWSSGESENAAVKLKELFPDVWFQGKGLLSTEGPMTIPWIESRGCLPLVNHTYYEFLDQFQNKLLLHELEIGKQYEIFPRFPNMETAYEMGDLVKCTGFYHKTPLLEFIGRKGDSSDLVGEKLSGNILRSLLSDILSDFVVIPNTEENHFYYTVLAENVPGKNLSSPIVEEKLLSIHHYKLARELDQLKAVKLIPVQGLKAEIRRIQLELGIREGDQKDLCIIKRAEIKEALYKWVLSISSCE